MSIEFTDTHAAGPGGLFATVALCGTTPSDEPDDILRLHAIDTEVSCARCRRLLLEVHP